MSDSGLGLILHTGIVFPVGQLVNEIDWILQLVFSQPSLSLRLVALVFPGC